MKLLFGGLISIMLLGLYVHLVYLGIQVVDCATNAGCTRYTADAYVMVWILAGFSALMTGLYHPRTLPALTPHGQAWLRLAVSAAYAYFGLSPQSGSNRS